MSSLTRNAEVTGWYSSPDSSRSSRILSDSFNDAKDKLKSELSSDDYDKICTIPSVDIQGVADAVSNAKRRYDARAHSKTRRKLNAFSTRVLHYGEVLNIVEQYHPEYAALAWGTFKFVFTTFLNHEECVQKFSKGLARIADCLPRSRLSALLYPTDEMEDAVASIYANIIAFAQKTISWYNRSPWAHVVSSITKPWAISFQDDLDAISDASRRVDDLANAASKAELRDTHLDIIDGVRDNNRNYARLKSELQQLSNLVGSRFLAVDQTMSRISQGLNIGFYEQRKLFSILQNNQILSLCLWAHIPTSGHSLKFARSMQLRRRDQRIVQLPDVTTLSLWGNHPRSSLLVLNSPWDSAAKDFTIKLIDLIKEAAVPILWVLRFADYWKQALTCSDVLRMLVLQALELNQNIQGIREYPITVAHMREASTEEDWLRLLCRALIGLPKVFIVLDADLLSHASQRDKHCATSLVDVLRSRLGTSVMLVMASECVTRTYLAKRDAEGDCFRIFQRPHSPSYLRSPIRRRTALKARVKRTV